MIPKSYGRQTGDTSIPLSWTEQGTKSFALVMYDPDAQNFIHWIVLDIPSDTREITEGASMTENMPAGSRELTTYFRSEGYGGPAPPTGTYI
jgi:Raf kinase inhibitor-like YbhB/YbcL family protein